MQKPRRMLLKSTEATPNPIGGNLGCVPPTDSFYGDTEAGKRSHDGVGGFLLFPDATFYVAPYYGLAFQFNQGIPHLQHYPTWRAPMECFSSACPFILRAPIIRWVRYLGSHAIPLVSAPASEAPGFRILHRCWKSAPRPADLYVTQRAGYGTRQLRPPRRTAGASEFRDIPNRIRFDADGVRSPCSTSIPRNRGRWDSYCICISEDRCCAKGPFPHPAPKTSRADIFRAARGPRGAPSSGSLTPVAPPEIPHRPGYS